MHRSFESSAVVCSLPSPAHEVLVLFELQEPHIRDTMLLWKGLISDLCRPSLALEMIPKELEMATRFD